MDYITKALIDADAADWITVTAYVIAAVLSYRAAHWAFLRREAKARLFWAGSALAMVCLGINEIFDFQTLLTAIGKAHAQNAGWYGNHRPVQFAFIIALGLLGIIACVATALFVRRLPGSIKLAVIGYIFIGIFVLFRAASFHHFDEFLGRGYQAFNLGSIQEMAGIIVVVIASTLYRKPMGKRN